MVRAPSKKDARKAPVRPEPAVLEAQAARTAADVQRRLHEWIRPCSLPANPADLKPEHVPRTQTAEEQILTALRVRQAIQDGKPVLPCAVCACYVGKCDVAEDSCPLPDLPALALLKADGIQRTPDMPRPGITHLLHDGVKYCLSPEGVTSPEDHQPARLRVCRACWSSLTKKNPTVPPRSLVRVDTGPWPSDGRGDLPSPTYVESLLLSSVVPSRKVVVMRPTRGSAPCGVHKKELTGHVVVVPATSVELLDSMLLPRNLDDLPDLLTVSAGEARTCLHGTVRWGAGPCRPVVADSVLPAAAPCRTGHVRGASA